MGMISKQREGIKINVDTAQEIDKWIHKKVIPLFLLSMKNQTSVSRGDIITDANAGLPMLGNLKCIKYMVCHSMDACMYQQYVLFFWISGITKRVSRGFQKLLSEKVQKRIKTTAELVVGSSSTLLVAHTEFHELVPSRQSCFKPCIQEISIFWWLLTALYGKSICHCFVWLYVWKNDTVTFEK